MTALSITPTSFLTSTVLCIALAGIARAQSLVPTASDVAYGSHPLETLDYYAAPSGSGPAPVLIEIHAGGWAGGFKSFFPLYGGLIEKANSRGIAIVSINYPLAPMDIFPASPNSCRRAVQFVRSMAATWNLDPERIATIGCSSGAHLAMWVGAAADAQDLGSPDPVKHFSSRVQAVVSYEGPSDLTDDYYKYSSAVGHGFTSPVWQFAGCPNEPAWDALPDTIKNDMSPRWHVLQANPPAVNQSLRYLGIFKSVGSANQSGQLPSPSADIHDLLQGLLFREALVNVGSPESTVWAGPNTYISGFGLVAAEMAADWLSTHLASTPAYNYGDGTPGCFGTQFLGVNSPPFAGNPNFELRSYNGWPGSLGILLASDSPIAPSADTFGIGLLMTIDVSHTLLALDMPVDAAGRGIAALPLPRNAGLTGNTFFFQALHVWTDPAIPQPCTPSPYLLSSTAGLALTIQ